MFRFLQRRSADVNSDHNSVNLHQDDFFTELSPQIQSAKLFSHIKSVGDEPFRTIFITNQGSLDGLPQVTSSSSVGIQVPTLNIEDDPEAAPALLHFRKSVEDGSSSGLSLDVPPSLSVDTNAVRVMSIVDMLQKMMGKNQMAIVPLGQASPGSVAIITNIADQDTDIQSDIISSIADQIDDSRLNIDDPLLIDGESEATAFKPSTDDLVASLNGTGKQIVGDFGVPLSAARDAVSDSDPTGLGADSGSQLFSVVDVEGSLFDNDNFDFIDGSLEIPSDRSDEDDDKLGFGNMIRKKTNFFGKIFGGESFDLGSLIDLL